MAFFPTIFFFSPGIWKFAYLLSFKKIVYINAHCAPTENNFFIIFVFPFFFVDKKRAYACTWRTYFFCLLTSTRDFLCFYFSLISPNSNKFYRWTYTCHLTTKSSTSTMSTAEGSASLLASDSIDYTSDLPLSISDVVFAFDLNKAFPHLSTKLQRIYSGSISLFLLIETHKLS